MSTQMRLSSEERRAAIMEAVLPLFAKKGFHGVTTRELAGAAGVSEALLYRHFPSKETLYEQILTKSCGISELDPLFKQFREIPPSTRKLVVMIYTLLYSIAIQQELALPRLMAASLLEDGEFARVFLKNFTDQWGAMFLESLEAAKQAGDVADLPIDDGLRLWFCQHLASALLFAKMPGRSSVDYGLPREQVVEQAVHFCLRGMGLGDSVIRKYYDPKQMPFS